MLQDKSRVSHIQTNGYVIVFHCYVIKNKIKNHSVH